MRATVHPGTNTDASLPPSKTRRGDEAAHGHLTPVWPKHQAQQSDYFALRIHHSETDLVTE